MASNTYNNKVVLSDGTVLIDLTTDTAVESKVLEGYYFHKATGERVEGTCPFDADTSDANATAGEILNSKTAYVNGSKVTGSMPNRGAATVTISTKAQQAQIQNGYHDGSGYAEISSTEQAKIIPTNIRQGVNILGVEGSMTGTEDVVATTGTVTPSWSAQTKTPTDFDEDANYISQFTVAAIPIAYVDNQQGGVTVTIG